MEKKPLSERIKEKAQKYKEQGYADKTFEKELNGKRVKMVLPNNIFEQQKLLNLGETLFSPSPIENYEVLDERYLREISKFTLIDGKELKDLIDKGLVELPYFQIYGALYYSELLAPLLVWRDIEAQELL